MLSLDSEIWSRLEHAYGTASDIPELLRQRSVKDDATQRRRLRNGMEQSRQLRSNDQVHAALDPAFLSVEARNRY
jgi:hypothetical protein